MKRIASWLAGLLILSLRLTCRVRVHNDPRPALAAQGIPHVFAILHAHQVAALLSAEPGTGAMVSRSADGEIIVPALRICGMKPIRGSSGKSLKGGVRALLSLIRHVTGGAPAVLAIDGPRGPRGHVFEGISLLSQKTGAVVLPLVAVASRRMILQRSWDRLQIPWLFSTLDIQFADGLMPVAGQSATEFAQQVERQLQALEIKYDREEAAKAGNMPTAESPALVPARRRAA
jgi:lysophospholipid acyltransferase (LPLAT)-like uncharacterized protein